MAGARRRALAALGALCAAATALNPTAVRDAAARGGAPVSAGAALTLSPGLSGLLSHFCIVTSYDGFEAMTARYAAMLGVAAPTTGTAGGNGTGTYLGKRLMGTTKIAFLQLNNDTRVEFLAGVPWEGSWWRDVFLDKGVEVHHQGYVLPKGTDIWAYVQAFAAIYGPAVQWGRWGTPDQPGSGCYAYCDAQASLGVTVEILANDRDCDNLPFPPAE